MLHQYSPREDPLGCGLAGCLGGGVLGLFGGGLLLVALAIIIAISRPDPTLEPTPSTQPDLRVTISETFLNRFIEQPAEGSVRVNVLPGNQVDITADTLIQGFGLSVAAQLTGRFEIQVADQALTVRLVDTQVQGFDLPPELTDSFSRDVPLINQNLQTMTEQIAQTLGTSITFMNLSTDENQIQINIREAR